MSIPRRRLIRPPIAPLPTDQQNQLRIQKLRSQLEYERMALVRWQKRLKRAFNAAEKIQKHIVRIERQISRLEE